MSLTFFLRGTAKNGSPFDDNMPNEKWGRKKNMIVMTIQGDLTEKQFQKIQRALLKIADRYQMGYAANDESGYDVIA